MNWEFSLETEETDEISHNYSFYDASSFQTSGHVTKIKQNRIMVLVVPNVKRDIAA